MNKEVAKGSKGTNKP